MAPKKPKPKPKPKKSQQDELTFLRRLKLFLSVHWRGVVCVLTPIIFMFVVLPSPAKKYQWCGYCLLIMATYWVTECIPLQVTSFIPLIIFPLTDVMNTRTTCKCYINDTILMFLGSLMLATAVEQSGLHKRLALNAIKCIGYSHYRTLFAVCFVTMFFSMWISNTAATTMMLPIVFAILKVYEYHGLIKIYEKDSSGNLQATRLATCYFCSITFAATIGGIGTLVGTATNLVFKGLFMRAYPLADEYLSFPYFSAFSVPYMLMLNTALYISMLVMYMGFGRPNSDDAKKIKIYPAGKTAAKETVESDLKKLGPVSVHEAMVLILFSGAMLMFFCRSPQIFKGWGDLIAEMLDLEDTRYVRDSAAAILVAFLMILLPSAMDACKNFTAKYYEQLPKGTVKSVLDWNPMNSTLPYSFMFLLGGGFALSTAAQPQYSNLNQKIGEFLRNMKNLPNSVLLFFIIVFTTFVTNFASNVAVCNVVAPIAMQLAKEVGRNPLWYDIAAGFSASFCFMIPVGTPGNLIVQSAAKIPTSRMIVAGTAPTICTIIISWFFVYFYAPVVWPVLKTLPDWALTDI